MRASRIRAVVDLIRSGGLLRLARVAEQRDPVAATLLRRVHRLVGGDEDALGAAARFAAEHRDSDADRHGLRLRRRPRVLADLGPEFLGQRHRPADVGLRHQDGELVAREAGDDVGRPDPLAHDRRHLSDQVVAGVVAERVIDQLEAVDVDDHHRALAAVAGAEGDELVEFGAETAPIEEPGQGIVIGEVAKLGLGPLGAFEGRLDHLAIPVLEFVEDRLDRRLALAQKSVVLHCPKVDPPAPLAMPNQALLDECVQLLPTASGE